MTTLELTIPSLPSLDPRTYEFKPEVGLKHQDFAYAQFCYDWADLELWRQAGVEPLWTAGHWDSRRRERVHPKPICPPVPLQGLCVLKRLDG